MKTPRVWLLFFPPDGRFHRSYQPLCELSAFHQRTKYLFVIWPSAHRASGLPGCYFGEANMNRKVQTCAPRQRRSYTEKRGLLRGTIHGRSRSAVSCVSPIQAVHGQRAPNHVVVQSAVGRHVEVAADHHAIGSRALCQPAEQSRVRTKRPRTRGRTGKAGRQQLVVRYLDRCLLAWVPSACAHEVRVPGIRYTDR